MFEIIQPYLDNIISSVVGGLVVWLPTRKREAINTQQTLIDLYQDSLTDLKARYEEKYQDLKATFDEKLSAFSNKIDGLEKSLDDWKKKYFNLKKDFDQYKKEHP